MPTMAMAWLPGHRSRAAKWIICSLRWQFPALGLNESDVIATFSGVRSVIGSGALDPSKEGREHALLLEDGLLTVAGGKLTTFRMIALAALRLAEPQLPHWRADLRKLPIFALFAPLSGSALALDAQQQLRLLGRYGGAAQALCDATSGGELTMVQGTQKLWAQLRWGARMEDVRHLDDLLLRRTRLGLHLASASWGGMMRAGSRSKRATWR